MLAFIQSFGYMPGHVVKIYSFVVSNNDNESMYFLSYTYGGGLVGTQYTLPFL